ncbi:hypothetical protein JZ751_024093 [Albula glossodonta]|uniref:Uncharacterized protein n=1 Tax=Albula glossodonta TaxID=121402 RepID=A0A8T2NFB6_9TELE|nr:hypothetical protein JZ751_024093 [Albula glossodonta]
MTEDLAWTMDSASLNFSTGPKESQVGTLFPRCVERVFQISGLYPVFCLCYTVQSCLCDLSVPQQDRAGQSLSAASTKPKVILSGLLPGAQVPPHRDHKKLINKGSVKEGQIGELLPMSKPANLYAQGRLRFVYGPSIGASRRGLCPNDRRCRTWREKGNTAGVAMMSPSTAQTGHCVSYGSKESGSSYHY